MRNRHLRFKNKEKNREKDNTHTHPHTHCRWNQSVVLFLLLLFQNSFLLIRLDRIACDQFYFSSCSAKSHHHYCYFCFVLFVFLDYLDAFLFYINTHCFFLFETHILKESYWHEEDCLTRLVEKYLEHFQENSWLNCCLCLFYSTRSNKRDSFILTTRRSRLPLRLTQKQKVTKCQ